ncbi:MAG TPA: CCA tRNA nucleotidyltransferase [Acidimicrobiales bacterium]|nr:CCA tRNA nucleotidyltransferase [Acidimicrobiales bacterium]
MGPPPSDGTRFDGEPFDRVAFDRVVREVRPLAEAFAAAGHRVYLVGGIVRDLIAGRQRDAPDIDLTTDATPDEIERVLDGRVDALWKQGARFGTIGCRLGGRVFEITTHRSEAYLSESRKPIVTFSRLVEDDLARRDFTVNAMAMSIPDGELIDPFDGRHDLVARVLRTPLAPAVSLSDDPLRMLRAARFVAGYALLPESETEAAIGALRDRLAIVSRERVRDELDKLLSVPDPMAGFALLRRTALLGEFIPELAGIDDASLELVRDVDGLTRRRAALFLPITDRSAARARARALKYSANEIDSIRAVLSAIDSLRMLDPVDPPGVRRLVRATAPLLDDALALAHALSDPRAAAVSAMIERLSAVEDLHRLEPELDGDEVQQLLGIAEGRDVGDALAFLLDLRLAEGVLGPDEARRRLRQWWRDRP